MKKIRTTDAGIPILKGEDFKTYGALRGEWIPKGSLIYTDYLPYAWREFLLQHLANHRVYVVFSYDTPIAWFVPDAELLETKWNEHAERWENKSTTRPQWVVPDVRYSRTTSYHQSTVQQAVTAFYDNVTEEVETKS